MDAIGIINQGLRKLGSFSVNSITPASSPIERKCAEGYSQWRKSELTKRRWVFNWFPATLSVQGSAPHATSERPFAFDLPADCLALIRKRGDTWRQHGRKIYAAQSTLQIEYKGDVPDTDLDPLFIDTLACRVAEEMCEWVTQSNVKKSDAVQMYKETIRIAAANNALIIGSEDSFNELDSQDEWMSARAGVGL
jgi:hypothetical protein